MGSGHIPKPDVVSQTLQQGIGIVDIKFDE